MLQDRDPVGTWLPDDLRAALREWAAAAETVRLSGNPTELDLLRRRGRQLAGMVADVTRRPVDFVDPVSGEAEAVGVGSRDPASGPPGPTPWATGLAVAAFFAVLVAIADVVLANAFSGAFGALWVPANLLVCAGTLPSLVMARRLPFWRWPALGAAAGLGAAWVVLLLGLLA